MTERPYLSIGEVLGLLLEEFPDVTISKIRFLESQGLIEPERTPSGYRKFYDGDVERLRTILREQRENFLPLRVIRDRLEQGFIDPDSSGSVTAPRGIRNVTIVNSTTAQRYEFDDDRSGELERPHPDTVITAHHPAARPQVTGVVPVISTTMAPAPGGAATVATPSTSAAPVPPVAPVAAVAADAAANHGGPAATLDDTAPVAVGRADTAPADTAPDDTSLDDTALDDTALDDTAPIPAVANPAASGVAAAASGVAAAPARVVSAVPPLAATASAVPTADVHETYSVGELCAATGVTAEQLTELESYGLLAPRRNAGSARYSHTDAQIARAAAGFLTRGVEARHLRAWRQAVDREAALFDQLILPLLRQRNPQARQQAANTLNELSGLGADLRAALLQSALKHHLEG